MACSSLSGRVLYYTPGGGGRGCRMRCRTAPSRLLAKAVAASEDCNEEECAPEKEVGKVSMEWKAAEGTQVVGTYPPLTKKKWTGYVEKDTAGQTNIYAVEPTVYVSENVISSNTAGDSSEGSEQTALVAVGLALGLLLGVGVVVSSTTSPAAPSAPVDAANNLSFYIQKFTPPAAGLPTSAEAPSADQPISPSSTAVDQPVSPAAPQL